MIKLSASELKKLPSDGGDQYNRLVFEKSPYLLQHAANPVDWFPWSDAAFEKALLDDKPIFLSIGYATCHWCHVMEHESFEDPEVAALMNANFVCIKVDREERPDIDQIYMAVTQALTGHGGWPMTAILAPDKKPFYTGTYFPKHSSPHRMGMLDLIPAIHDAWKNRREEILRSCEQITKALNKRSDGKSDVQFDSSLLDRAFSMFQGQFDQRYGGFGNSPKFPTPHNISFLIRYYKQTHHEDAKSMITRTLKNMRSGGIYDHVGFGFHRYATDEKWFLPHFEKMLYDQALHAMAYTEAFAEFKNPEYRKIAEEILEYVARDMTSPEGGFYSAEDADSEGVEGKFYLWSESELIALLGPSDASFAMAVFAATGDGNYYEEATREFTGSNILYQQKENDVLADVLKITETELVSRREGIRQKLWSEREGRVHPLKDDKILTDWNGLMIGALARAARIFEKPQYADLAKNAAKFIVDKLRQKDGRLLKRYRDGEAGLPAHGDDYAFLISGMLDLYEATFEIQWLRHAIELNSLFISHYWDEELGAFFFTADDAEKMIFRNKEIYDGAIPSANSFAMLNLIRLSRMTGEEKLESMAWRIATVFSDNISKASVYFAQSLIALDFMLGEAQEMVIVGEKDHSNTQRFLKKLNEGFHPNRVLMLCDSRNTEELGRIAPFTQSFTMKDNLPTLYVCRHFACEIPVTDPDFL